MNCERDSLKYVREITILIQIICVIENMQYMHVGYIFGNGSYHENFDMPVYFPHGVYNPGWAGDHKEKRWRFKRLCHFLCDCYQIMRNEDAPSVFDNLAMCPL